MIKIPFSNLPSTTTPVNATNLNALQDNVEDVFDGVDPMGNIVVDSIRSKNMFNPYIQSWTYGDLIYSVASDGKITQNASDGIQWQDSEGKSFILPAGTYTFSVIGKNSSNTFQVYNYNTSSSIYESTVSTFTYTFNEATRLGIKTYGSVYPDNYYIQIETGSTATSFSPYQELNNQETYSLSEQKIGTWINGNNIYRQSQQISKSSSGLITLLSISNLDVIVNICTYLKRDDLSGVYKNINNWGQTSGDYGTAFVEGNDIKFDSPYTGTLYITIEYTKTTD